MLGVKFACLRGMVFGLQMVAMRHVSVMGCGFHLAIAVLLGRLAMMVCRLLVVLGGGLVVIGDLVGVAHGSASSEWGTFWPVALVK